MSDKNRVRVKRLIPGTVVALALFGAIELGLRVVADGHGDPGVRMWALAASVAAGAFVSVLRGGGAAVLVVAVAGAEAAHAGDSNRDYTVTIASVACPTGTPGLWAADLKEPGLSTAGLRAWNLTVCPVDGQTITGIGSLKACVFRRTPGINRWVLSPLFRVDMTDDGYGLPVTTTLNNPCLTVWDVELGVNDGDLIFVFPSADFGVSGGATLRIILEGSRRL